SGAQIATVCSSHIDTYTSPVVGLRYAGLVPGRDRFGYGGILDMASPDRSHALPAWSTQLAARTVESLREGVVSSVQVGRLNQSCSDDRQSMCLHSDLGSA